MRELNFRYLRRIRIQVRGEKEKTRREDKKRRQEEKTRREAK
jgi:hypothetical protein